jgi:hypothetical protein
LLNGVTQELTECNKLGTGWLGIVKEFANAAGNPPFSASLE